MTNTDIYAQNQATTPTSHYNALRFAIELAKGSISTCTLVQVQKVTTSGQVAAIGRVDVLPLVDMIDGIARTTHHIGVHNLPYVRLSAGNKAVIMDPKVNDIGIAVFADRDISAVKASGGKQSPPGSMRRFNMADGIYISAVIADAPTCYVRFTDDDKIIAAVGQSNPCEFVIASDHVQMKHNGDTSMHVTIDVAGGQILAGKTIVIAPDPYPGD